MDESILFSLGFLSQNSLWKLSLNHGYKGIYRVRRNVISQFFPNKVFWRFDLVTRLSREFKPRANGLASLGLLSCSEQLARRFSFWHAWHVCINLVACSREPPARSSCESLLLCTHLSNSSLSHTLPLHDPHLNTGFLIAQIQANLARNKANKMVD